MLYLGIAVVATLIWWAARDNMKVISFLFAVAALISFITWIALVAFPWIENPSVPTPDIDVPGVR